METRNTILECGEWVQFRLSPDLPSLSRFFASLSLDCCARLTVCLFLSLNSGDSSRRKSNEENVGGMHAYAGRALYRKREYMGAQFGRYSRRSYGSELRHEGA